MRIFTEQTLKEYIEKHPDADKLVVCQLDMGDGQLQIVTGAKNLTVGDLVPVATDGATLPGGVKIKKGKLRGVVSQGMMCSIAELGVTLGDFPYAIEDGIFVLQEDCKPGDDVKEAIGLNDTVVEFEITSNRPDCLSVIGLARETAVTLDKPFNEHTPIVTECDGNINDLLDVKIETPLCKRYMARVVKNIKVEPSPRWLRERLRASGVRPISNIVDITNYVMLEYGQPMHAFDHRFVDGGKIIVRQATNGEKITTLDGAERELNENMMIIADNKKPIAVAGVMGGENSEITDDTVTVVFESANFARESIRKTSKSVGLRTISIIDLGGNIRIINNSEIGSFVNLSDVTSVAVVNVPVSYEDSLVDAENAVREALSELPSEYPDIFKDIPIYKGVDKLLEENVELMVVANVAEENIYNARRLIQREIKISFEKAGI